MIVRHYQTVGGKDAESQWQIHYREAGVGIPIILLHPSPTSSCVYGATDRVVC